VARGAEPVEGAPAAGVARPIPWLQVAGYQPHALHAPGVLWGERNCYVDVLVELLHVLRLEPRAMLGVCASVDFEGDHVTFVKPSLEELRHFYGLDVQELTLYKPLVAHAQEQLALGRLVNAEVDAYWLPDTAGTDYHRQHVKTSVIMAELDVRGRRLGYFHNAGYHEVTGDDFDRLLRLHAPPDPAYLPLYAELIRLDRVVHRPLRELAALAWGRLAVHVARRPESNPVWRWGVRFAADLPQLQAGGLARYHAWAFATTRQMGAAMELLAAELWWLQAFAPSGSATHAALQRAASAFLRLSQGCKSFILKGARGVSTGRPLDVTLLFDDMATAWEEGMAAMQEALRDGLDAPGEDAPPASAPQGAGGHPDDAKDGDGGHHRHDELAADLPLLVVRA
jgi:hypothetical protein